MMETRLAGMVVSSEQETRIGLQLKNELETTKGIVYLEDPSVLEYVRGVAARVIDVASQERPPHHARPHRTPERVHRRARLHRREREPATVREDEAVPGHVARPSGRQLKTSSGMAFAIAL